MGPMPCTTPGTPSLRASKDPADSSTSWTMTSGRQSWVIASRSVSRASAGLPNSATTPSIIFCSSGRSGSDHTASCADHASAHVGPTARTSSPRPASGPSMSGPVATRTSFPARSAARIKGSIGSTCPYAGHDVNSTRAMPASVSRGPAPFHRLRLLAVGDDRPYLVRDLVGNDRLHEVRGVDRVSALPARTGRGTPPGPPARAAGTPGRPGRSPRNPRSRKPDR